MSHTIPEQRPLDMVACEELMRGGSKSFFAASSLLPQRIRTAAIALYAFCRVADDAIDLHGDDPQAMQNLLDRLENVYAGRPDNIIEDRALAMVVRAHKLPRELPDALLEGFAWDATGRGYETIEELHDYCARVAGSVGAMMALIMGVKDAQVMARACELGNAMQLTNIARDVGEDARNGRLYLPRAWMREAGINPDAWLANPVFTPALASVIGRVLLEADRLYKQASTGVAALPRDCRSAILAASMIYAEIGQVVAKNCMNSIDERAVVSKARKLTLLCLAKTRAQLPGRCDLETPPLPAIQFLLNACNNTPLRANNTAVPADRNFDERVEWMIDLFERLSVPRKRI
jgi:phytoene synthase